MKMLLKKKILIVVIALAVGIVGLTAVGTAVGVAVYNGRPEVKLTRGIEDLAEGLAERDEVGWITEVADGGLVSFYFNMQPDSKNSNDEERVSFGGDIYIEESGNEVMIKNGFVWDNDSESDKRFNAYITDAYGYVESDVIGGIYGYKKGEMERAFITSPFYTKDQYISLSDESKAYYRELFAMYDEGYADVLLRDALDYGKKYYRIIMRSVLENAEITETEGQILPEGSSYYRNADTITVKLYRDGIIEVLSTLYERLSEDERLREDFIRHYERLASAMGEERDDASVVYYELLAQIKLEIEKAKDEYSSDYYECISLSRDAETDEVFNIAVRSFDGKRENSVFSLSIEGESVREATAIILTLEEDEYKYSVPQNGDGGYKAFLTKNENDILTFDIYGDDTYSLVLLDEEENAQLTFSGDWRGEDGKTEITVTEVLSEGEKVNITAEITVDRSASMPKPKKAEKNIFDMELRDLEKYFFVGQLSDRIMSGEYRYEFNDFNYLQLDFDGLSVTCTTKMGENKTPKAYKGYYLIKGDYIIFYFDDEEAYFYFERGSNPLYFYKEDLSLFSVSGYEFSKYEEKSDL